MYFINRVLLLLCVTEYYQEGSGICVPCPHGTFSFTQTVQLEDLEQSDVCQPCPSDATECYGDSIIVSSGFWRINVRRRRR